MRRGEPRASMMVVVQGVPGVIDVRRGSVLNLKINFDVLYPLTRELEHVEDWPIRTNAFVLDIRGGKDGAGEILLLDKHGGLVVCNTLEDAEEFQRNLIAKPTSEGPRRRALRVRRDALDK